MRSVNPEALSGGIAPAGDNFRRPRTAALMGVLGADHGKTVAGCEGGRGILQSREGPGHG